ncbi:MAG: 23S rRNA (guanosine(2251)-2'-O)-methyltransferase RlmB [Bacteroidota bacterium]
MEHSNLHIYGRKPIQEQLEQRPEKVEKLFVRNSLKDQQIAVIMNLCSQHRIPVVHVPGRKLYDLVGNVNDQGVVAQLSAVAYDDFGAWISKVDTSTYPAVLLLDGIEDPHNMGAILRSAAAAGIQAVLVPKHGQAPVNATVFKTSAGTAGRIPIVRMGNTNQTIMELKEAGFWIGGLADLPEAETTDEQSIESIWTVPMDRAMVFIIGSEGSGIRKKTLEHCDYVIRIPMEHEVESLNASVSAALISYEWKRRRMD